jgi:hypothetical protein
VARPPGPAGQDLVDRRPDLVPGVGPRDAGHEQVVVVSVLVPHRGNDGQRDRALVQVPAGRRPPDPAAAPLGGVPGDGLGAIVGAARVQPDNLLREPGLELHVLLGAPLAVAFPAPHPGVLVVEALLFGGIEGGFADQEALPLVALATAAADSGAGAGAAAGSVPTFPGDMYDFIAIKADSDGMLPPWTSWWDPADVTSLFPSTEVRESVQRAEPRLPLSYFRESVPVPAGWDSHPGAYLAFGDTYAKERSDAAARGWPVRTLPGEHLHMLVDPEQVTAELVTLLAALGPT